MQRSNDCVPSAGIPRLLMSFGMLAAVIGCSDTSPAPVGAFSDTAAQNDFGTETALAASGSEDKLTQQQPIPVPPVTLSITAQQIHSQNVDGDGTAVGGSVANNGTTNLNSADTGDVSDQILAEIRRLRIQPLPAETETAIVARRQRNLKIVEMAADVLRRTLDEPDRQATFLEGIQQLLEARFQLALNGSKVDIDQLYADVQALSDRDPKSPHAAEGIYTLARFAHTQARLLGRDDPAWFENFSRWAREFADRFEDQPERAVALLIGAGRSCELHAAITSSQADADRLLTEAKLCFVALADRFPETTQGQEATAVLRRLALPGHKLSQFAGPTLEGSYVTAEGFVEQVTVIYFWDSQNQDFVDKLLPLLHQAHQVSNAKLRFVGVTLDADEQQVRDFVERHKLPGQQIFFPQAAQRAWNSPIIRFWGISKSPTVWLIDRGGKVSSVDVGPATLVSAMRKLFK